MNTTCTLEVCPATVSDEGLCRCTLERIGIPQRGSGVIVSVDDTTRLTTRKMLSVETEHGYKRSGYILTSDSGDVAIVDKAVVRWVDKKDFWALMHSNTKL